MCICVLFSSHACKCPQRSGEGVRSPEAGFMGSCQTCDMHAENRCQVTWKRRWAISPALVRTVRKYTETYRQRLLERLGSYYHEDEKHHEEPLASWKSKEPCHIIKPKSMPLRTKDSRCNICSYIKVQKHTGMELGDQTCTGIQGPENTALWCPRAGRGHPSLGRESRIFMFPISLFHQELTHQIVLAHTESGICATVLTNS